MTVLFIALRSWITIPPIEFFLIGRIGMLQGLVLSLKESSNILLTIDFHSL